MAVMSGEARVVLTGVAIEDAASTTDRAGLLWVQEGIHRETQVVNSPLLLNVATTNFQSERNSGAAAKPLSVVYPLRQVAYTDAVESIPVGARARRRENCSSHFPCLRPRDCLLHAEVHAEVQYEVLHASNQMPSASPLEHDSCWDIRGRVKRRIYSTQTWMEVETKISSYVCATAAVPQTTTNLLE